jgi:sporulation protein YlmC with PRC-barrel domain
MLLSRMKSCSMARCALLTLGFMAAPFPLLAVASVPTYAQDVALVRVDISVVDQGYRASKLIGTNVKNDKGESVGEIDDVIVDQQRVLYAILEVGGFLGIGAHLVAVPYEALTLNATGQEITLPGASKDEIKKLEEFNYR